MATAHDYRLAYERCLNCAHNASDRNVRQTWLELADSYHLLLMLDRVLTSSEPLVART